eukprot:gene2776-5465_t
MSTQSFYCFTTNLSTFPGMNFNPEDSGLKKGHKSDPMLSGVDLDGYDEIQEKIEEMIADRKLPKRYTIHDNVHLLHGKVFDTTNRNVEKWAKKDSFDSEGFSSGKPLRRDIFYRDPYITCRNCNAVNFVDSMAVRRYMQLPKSLIDKLPKEALPKCTGCRRTDCYEIGAEDYSEDIAERRRKWLEHQRRIHRAARSIQRAFRSHLRMMFGKAYLGMNFAHKKLLDKAASQINALCRGRLDRRRYKTEKALRVIRMANPVLLHRALRLGGVMKVFWYHGKVEQQMIHANYLELVEHTGFYPPRFVVEQNIQEIARRIQERENFLIRLIQKKERREERMARAMARIESPLDYGNCRLKAFGASCYADERVQAAVLETVRSSLNTVRKLRKEVELETRRKKFIIDRIREQEDPVFGNISSLSSPLPILPSVDIINKPDSAGSARSKGFIKKLDIEGDNDPERSKRMKAYFEEELGDLMGNLIERGLKSKGFKFPEGLNDKPMEWLFEESFYDDC